jgi:hypothetical protein
MQVVSSPLPLDVPVREPHPYEYALALFGKHSSVMSFLTPAASPPVFLCHLREQADEAIVKRLFTGRPGVFRFTFPVDGLTLVIMKSGATSSQDASVRTVARHIPEMGSCIYLDPRSFAAEFGSLITLKTPAFSCTWKGLGDVAAADSLLKRQPGVSNVRQLGGTS